MDPNSKPDFFPFWDMPPPPSDDVLISQNTCSGRHSDMPPPPPPPSDDIPPFDFPVPQSTISGRADGDDDDEDDNEDDETELADAYSQVIKRGEAFPGLAVGGVPSAISRMAEEIAKVEMVPLEFSSVCCLGELSAAAGRHLRVNGLCSRTSRANLFIFISAKSTSGKTTVINYAFKPLRDLDASVLKNWLKTVKPGIEADLILAKGALKKLEKEIEKGGAGAVLRKKIADEKERISDLEGKLEPPCLISEDFSSEALGIRLKQSDEVLTIISSDARKLVQNLLGRNTSDNQTDESLLLKGWSGDPDSVHRVSRKAVFLKEPCLSATLAIQDDKFEEIFANRSITESGLTARFLVMKISTTKRQYSVTAPGIDPKVLEAYADSILSIARAFLVPHWDLPVDQVVPMTSEAIKAFCGYTQECEDLAHGELNGVEMYVRRWAENAHRIALCLHVATHEAKAASIPLSVETMEHAIALQRWFNAHQLQALRTQWERARSKRRDKLSLILQSKTDSLMTVRQLRREYSYKGEDLNALAREFPEHFRLEKVQSGGRPSRVVRYIYNNLLTI